ncbi:MAG TPA: hypothetical protein PK079_04755 [Leptospiraceae bacterium]|nr:hypothetical protein [Leptospiraceae bacterium]HMX31883.1 hypothetical protein [Leptospiraceae bacterium]HMY30811.1 hypothetical protein [Leptospiraceae bacterium]HMZ64272.1 hypothetical protein [Leptospiraceae bacterium]HNA08087.1 hypothetical protein [Leptospiraceae bacterium]
MEKSLTYDKSINFVRSNSSTPYWYESVQNFDSGDYKKSFFNLLRYVNSTITIPNESSESIELKIPHGSVIVSIKLDSKKYSIEAPFLKVPEGGSGIGMMRQIAELNFSYLVLGQIVLRGNDFYIQYEDNLENCEPYKIYSLLEEICFCADYYDDVFAEKFKTEYVVQPVLEVFSQAEKDLAYQKFNSIIKEGISFIDYFEMKRFYGLACDTLETTFLKIDYVIAPQGILGSKLSETRGMLYANDSLQTVVANTKAKLQEFLSYDRAKFDSCLFHPKFLIPIKKRGELPYIQDFMRNTYETMTGDMGNKSYMNVTVSALFLIYDLFYKNAIPQEITDHLDRALEKAGGKDWKTSAEALYDSVNKIMNLNPEEDITGKLGVTTNSNSSTGSSREIKSTVTKSIFGKITGLLKKELGDLL